MADSLPFDRPNRCPGQRSGSPASRGNSTRPLLSGPSGEQALKSWFVDEVLPLEAVLTRYLARHWSNRQDIADLRQEIYAKIISSARQSIPANVRAFMFVVAKNHLINSGRRIRLISISHVADADAIDAAIDVGRTERHIVARDELRVLQAGLNRLPPKCRQVVVLRKVSGYSQQEVAEHLGVTTDTVERQMVLGMKALTDFMMGGSGRIDRKCSGRLRSRT